MADRRTVVDTQSRNRRLWTLAWVGVVGATIVLAATGMIFAIRQAQALASLRIADLRPEAQLAIERLHKQALPELSALLRHMAENVRSDRDADLGIDLIAADRAPSWVGDIYVQNEAGLATWTRSGGAYRRSVEDTTVPETTDTLNRIVSGRLAPRLNPATVPVAELCGDVEFLYEVMDGRPLVLAYLAYAGGGGEVGNGGGGGVGHDHRIVAAVVDLAEVRRTLLEPILDSQRVQVAPVLSLGGRTGGQMPAWHEDAAPLAPFLALIPAQPFVDQQQAVVLRRSILFIAIAVVAMAALLAVVWGMWRVVRREVALSRMKQNFVADVSHELKTPLALIQLFSETLMSNRVSSDEKRREYHEIIVRETQRLTHLIDNILDFSRMEAGRKQYHMQRSDVAQIARQTYNAYSAQLDHEGFEHQLVIGSDLPQIYCDPDALAQALINLITNAVKYAEDEKVLVIDLSAETRRGHHGVLISVSDRGIGITPENRSRLFGEFFRADDDRVRRRRGAGIGLALVKRIVDAHDGIVDVESRLVKGSTFRIFLPETNRHVLGEVHRNGQDSDR